ncbi:hypothetical protein, variant [Exophiala mesophila]|nr:hypothetical protein, variant [Exophiala mesophila]KIV92549.1 hypothetical protein, variant [Exophiala mesophila]
MLSVLQSVLTQDEAPNDGHDQPRNDDADEHSSTEPHGQFAHGLPTPPTSVRALRLEGSGVVELTAVEGGSGISEVNECKMVPKEAQRRSDQDHLPVLLSWGSPTDAMATGSDFKRPGKTSFQKTSHSRVKEPKSRQVARHDGLLTAAMLQTIDRIGEVQVLEGLRGTIAELEARAWQDSQTFNERGGQIIPKHLTDQPDSMRKLWLLKEELVLTESNEQIHRLRKRLTLAEFSHAYDACALRYMGMGGIPQRPRSRPGQRVPKTAIGREARNSQHKRAAMDHFVNLLFPGALPTSKTKRTARKAGTVTRYAAARKIQNWRAAGQPWANIITRFGKGMLLLIPDEVSDAYMRTMSKATLSAFLDRVERRVAGWENWLPTLTPLVDSICINHALPRDWFSEECPSWLNEGGRTDAQIWKTDPDSPSALGEGGTAPWSPLRQSGGIDQQWTEPGLVFDPPMDANELGLYMAESSSQFALAPHETVREAPYTTFLACLAGETNLAPDLCSAFTSVHDGFPLPPNEVKEGLGVDIDAFLAKSPVLPSLTADAPGNDVSDQASTSVNRSYCDYHDSPATYAGMEARNVNCEDEFFFFNFPEDSE